MVQNPNELPFMAFQDLQLSSRTQHLRIGIDGRCLQGNRRGDGRYVFELCRQIDKRLPSAVKHN